MTAPSLGFRRVKVVALSVTNADRANKFYGETIGLPPAHENSNKIGYMLGESVLMLKEQPDLPPTSSPNPRVTLECDNARQTESELRSRGVNIADACQIYDVNHCVGSFLDSEGNKIWFCSFV
jgi:catechol 2,3-dioxygenase-like lactoylglutathione lyase family enzyme